MGVKSLIRVTDKYFDRVNNIIGVNALLGGRRATVVSRYMFYSFAVIAAKTYLWEIFS